MVNRDNYINMYVKVDHIEEFLQNFEKQFGSIDSVSKSAISWRRDRFPFIW